MNDPTFTTAEGSFEKINNLWDDDADVVFCAGKSAFRVHRGILCAQSQVFNDMFALPQGETEVQITSRAKNKSFTVIYAPDDEKELYYFFLAIFVPRSYPRPPSDIPLHVTLSIFRLAHKYDAASLVLRTAEYLNFLFPLHREVLLSIAAGDDSCLRIKGNAATLLEMLLDLLGIAHISEIDWIIPCAIFVMVNRYEAGIIVKHPCYAKLCPRLKTMISECSNSVNTTWASFLPVWNCVDPLVCYYMSKNVQADSPLSAARYFVVNAAGPPGSVLSFCHHCQEAGRWHLSESEETCWGCHPVICGFASWNAVMERRDTEMEKCRIRSEIGRDV